MPIQRENVFFDQGLVQWKGHCTTGQVESEWKSNLHLGVIFDSHLELKDHVSKVVQSAWVGVRKVGHLRKFLNPLSSEKLVHAFITSHLDYCNSLLFGLPDKDISRLQRIQNASARIIKCTKRSDSISRLLQDLHWLPVHLRVKFKILLTMFKCVTGSAPDAVIVPLISSNISIGFRSTCG